MTNNQSSQTLPTIYKKRKDGKFHQVSIGWGEDSKGVFIFNEHGIVDGEKQRDINYALGKNIGKKNETTALAQAESEAKSKWKTKLDSGYSLSQVQTSTFMPMLAQPLDALESCYKGAIKEKSTDFWTQPKLDGVRAVCFLNSDGQVVFQSRKSQVFGPAVNHLVPLIRNMLLQGLTLDGEIYTIDPALGIQEIAGALLKKERDDNIHNSLGFYVFDCYYIDDSDATFQHRYARLSALYALNSNGTSDFTKYIKLVPGESKSFSDFENLSDFVSYIQDQIPVYTSQGHEGLMVRFCHLPYEQSRSRQLVKCKSFLDAEYPVINVIAPSTGRDEGTAIYVCKTNTGLFFNAPSMGTREERKDIYKNRNSYIGKQLVVTYQNLTEDGIPRFPKGLRIREED